MQRLVCETLSIFPEKIIDLVTKNVWFVSSFDDSWGFVLKGEEIGKNKYLIFLGDELFLQEPYAQSYTIAHEIAHVMSGHKNAILESQTREETAKQEKDADLFARHYLEASGIKRER